MGEVRYSSVWADRETDTGEIPPWKTGVSFSGWCFSLPSRGTLFPCPTRPVETANIIIFIKVGEVDMVSQLGSPQTAAQQKPGAQYRALGAYLARRVAHLGIHSAATLMVWSSKYQVGSSFQLGQYIHLPAVQMGPRRR